MRAGILRFVLILAIGSDYLLRELNAAEHMEMNVHNRLAAVFSAVINYSEAFADALDLSDFADSLCDLSGIESTLGITCQFINVIEVLLRNNENMNGSYRIDIVEAENVIILVYLIGRDLSINYVAE